MASDSYNRKKVIVMLRVLSFRSTLPFLSALLSADLDGGAAGLASASTIPLTSPSWAVGITTWDVEERIAFAGLLKSGQSCTVVYAADDDIAPAGNNEDWTALFAEIQFVPASEGKLGRVR